MSSTIDISKLNKAEVLAALYNRSHPQGLGHLQFVAEKMTTEEAAALLKETHRFDYLKGRVMKVNVGKDELWTALYDRDVGQGAAAEALQPLFDALEKQ